MGVYKIMARDLDTIKEELKTEYPTLKSGNRIFGETEYNKTIDSWAEEVRAKELDIEANGYKYARKESYPDIAEQLDKLYHDINNGTLDETGEFFTALKTVKDDNPKPSE